jgi:hypothetical protein
LRQGIIERLDFIQPPMFFGSLEVVSRTLRKCNPRNIRLTQVSTENKDSVKAFIQFGKGTRRHLLALNLENLLTKTLKQNEKKFDQGHFLRSAHIRCRCNHGTNQPWS